MKVRVELDIEPEEMRRLIGLPDMQPIWDAVQNRISDGDTEMVQQVAKSALTEGMKTLNMTTSLLRTLSGLASRREEGDAADGKKEPEKSTTRSRSRSSSKSKE